jgi:hypothetical protein
VVAPARSMILCEIWPPYIYSMLSRMIKSIFAFSLIKSIIPVLAFADTISTASNALTAAVNAPPSVSFESMIYTTTSSVASVVMGNSFFGWSSLKPLLAVAFLAQLYKSIMAKEENIAVPIIKAAIWFSVAASIIPGNPVYKRTGIDRVLDSSRYTSWSKTNFKDNNSGKSLMVDLYQMGLFVFNGMAEKIDPLDPTTNQRESDVRYKKSVSTISNVFTKLTAVSASCGDTTVSSCVKTGINQILKEENLGTSLVSSSGIVANSALTVGQVAKGLWLNLTPVGLFVNGITKLFSSSSSGSSNSSGSTFGLVAYFSNLLLALPIMVMNWIVVIAYNLKSVVLTLVYILMGFASALSMIYVIITCPVLIYESKREKYLESIKSLMALTAFPLITSLMNLCSSIFADSSLTEIVKKLKDVSTPQDLSVIMTTVMVIQLSMVASQLVLCSKIAPMCKAVFDLSIDQLVAAGSAIGTTTIGLARQGISAVAGGVASAGGAMIGGAAGAMAGSKMVSAATGATGGGAASGVAGAITGGMNKFSNGGGSTGGVSGGGSAENLMSKIRGGAAPVQSNFSSGQPYGSGSNSPASSSTSSPSPFNQDGQQSAPAAKFSSGASEQKQLFGNEGSSPINSDTGTESSPAPETYSPQPQPLSDNMDYFKQLKQKAGTGQASKAELSVLRQSGKMTGRDLRDLNRARSIEDEYDREDAMEALGQRLSDQHDKYTGANKVAKGLGIMGMMAKNIVSNVANTAVDNAVHGTDSSVNTSSFFEHKAHGEAIDAAHKNFHEQHIVPHKDTRFGAAVKSQYSKNSGKSVVSDNGNGIIEMLDGNGNKLFSHNSNVEGSTPFVSDNLNFGQKMKVKSLMKKYKIEKENESPDSNSYQ